MHLEQSTKKALWTLESGILLQLNRILFVFSTFSLLNQILDEQLQHTLIFLWLQAEKRIINFITFISETLLFFYKFCHFGQRKKTESKQFFYKNMHVYLIFGTFKTKKQKKKNAHIFKFEFPQQYWFLEHSNS